MAARATTLSEFGIFGDEMYTSTDLNRRSGEVLDRASMRPVTISRNNERFALLRREQAYCLVRVVNGINPVIELLSEARVAINGEQPSPAFAWLKIFDKDDLEKLCSEVLTATRSALVGRTEWDDVEATIHEWGESAAVAQSGELDAAMYHDESNEEPLPHPDQVAASRPAAAASECATT